jgi:hypothetical protein
MTCEVCAINHRTKAAVAVCVECHSALCGRHAASRHRHVLAR